MLPFFGDILGGVGLIIFIIDIILVVLLLGRESRS
jgi:hypothetical protein